MSWAEFILIKLIIIQVNGNITNVIIIKKRVDKFPEERKKKQFIHFISFPFMLNDSCITFIWTCKNRQSYT